MHELRTTHMLVELRTLSISCLVHSFAYLPRMKKNAFTDADRQTNICERISNFLFYFTLIRVVASVHVQACAGFVCGSWLAQSLVALLFMAVGMYTR